MVSAPVRNFAAHGHGHDDHGHGHDDHHDDHHHHVEKADPNQKFIAPTDKRFLVFNGLRATTPYTAEFENPFRHHNDLGLLQYA